MLIDDTWFGMMINDWEICTLPKANIVPENRWLQDYFPFGSLPMFRDELLVLGRVKTMKQIPPATEHHMSNEKILVRQVV